MFDSESSASLDGLAPETNEFTTDFKFPPLPKFCLKGRSASSCSDDDWSSGEDELHHVERRPHRRSKLPVPKLSSYHPINNDELPPIGFFWDIENCQVPKKCSAISVVAAIREAFLPGRREAEFTVVCDARKERPALLKELNDSQVNLLHVCGTQKNAADDKLRQCMRRYAELHAGTPASPRHQRLAPALLLISGDVNFASDLSDFRYRKKMHVILVHKINTSQALIACATTNHCYTSLTANLPREEKEESPCTYLVDLDGIPPVVGRRRHQITQRLQRLADNCGGKVFFLEPPNATLEYQSYHQAHRALKRMDGEDVFGHKIRVLPSVRSQYNGGVRSSCDDVYQASGIGGRPLSAPPAPPPTPASAHKRTSQQSNPTLPLPAFPQSHLSDQFNQGQIENGSSVNKWVHGYSEDTGSTHRKLHERTPMGYRSIRGTHGERHNYSRNTMHHSQVGSSFPPSHSQSPSPVPSHSPQSHNSVTPSPSPSPTMMDPALWNTSERSTSDHSDGRSGSPPGSPPYVDITVTNLEHSADPTAVRNMLHRIFSVHVPVVEVSVRGTSDSLAARVRVRGTGAAQLAVASLHRRRVAGRRLVLSLTPPPPATPLPLLRRQVASLLQSAPDQQLPLFRLREMFALRHGRALPTAEVSRLRDTCALVDSPRGRSVRLLRVPPPNPHDHQWWGESGVCALHGGEESTEGSSGGVGILPIFVDLSVFAQRLHAMLSEHGGVLLVNSLPQCYQAQFGEHLPVDPVGGVALEHVISCVNGLALRAQPPPHSRKLVVLASSPTSQPPPPVASDAVSSGFGSASTDEEVPGSLASLRALLARELLDLLRKAPRCQMPFTRLIPSYHLHFGKQCRVADYGFTKLADLLDSLSHTIQVMGEGLGRVITLSHSAQIRRFTLDLLKVLRAQPDKSLMLHQLPELYRRTLGREFDPVEYGACRAEDLVGGVARNCVALGPEEGRISLPRHRQTPKEESRIRQFALQAIELLRHAPNCRLELSKFVPAYHTHFGRQLRVAYYGLPKVQDLFYAIPDTIEMWTNEEGERVIGLHYEAARKVIGPQIAALPLPVSLASLPEAYFSVHGGDLLPEAYGCPDLITLLRCLPNIQLIEGFGEGGAIIAPVDTSTPRITQQQSYHTKEIANEPVNNAEQSGWGIAGLLAYRVLVSDLCVSNGGPRIEHFCREFRAIAGQDPPLNVLTRNNCIKIANDRVVLTLLWRCVGRMVSQQGDLVMTPVALAQAYQHQYQHQLPAESLGFDSVSSLINHCSEVWEHQNGHVRVKSALTTVVPPEPKPHVELLPTTPPGQKSSSVWNTPPAIPRGPWTTPPTSPAPCMLPLPAAHLFSNTKRKVRLAAQFNSPA